MGYFRGNDNLEMTNFLKEIEIFNITPEYLIGDYSYSTDSLPYAIN